MGCCSWTIGLAAVAFGAGILIGCLAPSWLAVWLMGVVLVVVGLLLLRRW